MNQKIRIAACDDDATVLSVLPDALNNVFKGQADVDCFSSGRELLEQMKKAIYDIIILDINMPDMNGLALGKRIRAMNATVELVYLSNREDKVFDTFAVSPMTFIRKSAFFSDIAKLAVLYEHNHARGGEGERLIVKDKDSVFLLDYAKIRYIENFRNTQYIYADAGREPYTVRSTMRKLQEQLDKACQSFVLINSGMIVNLAYVRRLNHDSVVLEQGEELAISRSNRVAVKKRFFEYLAH